MSSGDKNCIRVDGLAFTNTLSSTYYYRGALCHLSAGSAHFHIANCSFTNCGDSGAYIGGPYCVATNNTATNCAAYGVRLMGLSSLYEDNTTTGGCRGGAQGGRFSVTRYSKIYNAVTSYNGMHSDSIGFMDGGADSLNHYGHIYGCWIDNFVEGFALYGTGGGMTNWLIHSNVVVSRRSETGYGDGSIMLQGCHHMYFFNNTFVGFNAGVLGATGSAVLYIEDHSSGPDATDNTYIVFKNNLIAGESGSGIRVDANQLTGFESANNHFYYTNNTTPFMYAGPYQNLSQWLALGYESGFHSTHGLTTDPAFKDFANQDFTLASSSPDIGAGEDLSAYFTLDHAGNTRTAWDLGAYRYASGAEVEETGGGYLAFAVGSNHLVLAVSA